MKTTVLRILVLLLTAGAVQATQEAEWVKYNSTEGRYQVSFPAQPKLSQQEAKNADGETFQQFMAGAQTADAIYQAVYFDIPAGRDFKLDKARDGMVKAVGGSLVNERAIVLDGNAGREIKITAKLGDVDYNLVSRFAQFNSRVYMLAVAFPKAKESETLDLAFARYFDSFHILQQ